MQISTVLRYSFLYCRTTIRHACQVYLMYWPCILLLKFTG